MAFDLGRLRRELRPVRLHWFTRLNSTSDHAATLRRRGQLYAPSAVLTGHQLAGRGRGNHAWWSGNGSLTVTFAFAALEHLPAHHVPLIAGVAIRNAIAPFVPNHCLSLKWPNDVLCDGRKLAGILCERVERVDLIGIGLNVNVAANTLPVPLRSSVISVQLLAGGAVDMTDVLLAISANLYEKMVHRDESSFASVMAEYDQHHALLGQRVTVLGNPGEPSASGIVQGLDGTGRLLLRDRSKRYSIVAGHVVWTPPVRKNSRKAGD